MPFTLALAGRPNVGKSTLFNRLIGKAMALIDDQPGVTRDWREGEGKLFDLPLRVLDTAGLEDRRAKGSLAARMAERTQQALRQADVIVFMVDARAGLTPDDKAVAREVRKVGKPVLLLANKCDGAKLPPGFDELSALGFDEPLPFSAVHGDGMQDLFAALQPYVPQEAAFAPDNEAVANDVADDETEDDNRPLHIALAGRPNAGKSTLVNRLLGEDRMLTGPEPGLTRDAIQIHWTHHGQKIRLVDTAGMRRRARIDERIEKMSVAETLRAIRLAHVVILVLDGNQPFDKQDYTIAQHVAEEGRALVVAVNKWDTVEQKPETLRMIKAKVEASLAQITGVPIVTLSALTGEGVDRLMREVTKITEVWNKRVSTGQLNRWLGGMTESHSPPLVAGRRIKLRYMTQTKARPPTFALFVNKPVDLPESYVRFLTNGLRQAFHLGGVPIRWILRKGDNPYEGKKGLGKKKG
jgi:GTP-binding protein